MDRKPASSSITGTGGAVPVRNEKGEISMQKVKVHRYVAGKRPKYAPESDEEEEIEEEEEVESELEEEMQAASRKNLPDLSMIKANAAEDRRLKRLMDVENEASREQRLARHRQVAEPVVLEEDEEEDEENSEIIEASVKKDETEEEEEENEVDEAERAKRRLELKKKALQRQEELMTVEEEQNQGSESESEESEYEEEEYTDSEDEVAPRLKPVFVRRKDRVTIQEQKMEKAKEKEIEAERERLHLDSKKHTRKMIEEIVSKEKLAEKETDDNIQCDFETDDENNENDYEDWKLRELRRIKRDRDEREGIEKEKQEIQKIRNMTEEERLEYLKANPKVITNQGSKGKYKFLQKYYHRGAFFMDKEEGVFRQNFAEPTLEDHFDKTILPKVMQVKNFGMAGRTKYTHLLDQDTSRMDDNPWGNQEKFISGKGGGTKQVFDKPTAKKRK